MNRRQERQVSIVAGRLQALHVETPSNPHPPLLRHQAIFDSQEVTQVNISAATGDMGILASHVPSVEELKPGLFEVIESSGTKKWFGEHERREQRTSMEDSEAQ